MNKINKYLGGAKFAKQMANAFKRAYKSNDTKLAQAILNTLWTEKTGKSPVQLYHGTAKNFNAFDLNRLGDNTGKGYFNTPEGTVLPFDSERAIMLTTHLPTAANYGFLLVEKDLNTLEDLATRDNLTQELRQQAQLLLTKFPSLKEASDLKDRQLFFKRLREMPSAQGASNIYNNYTNLGKNLQILKSNIGRIINGDESVEFNYGPLSTYGLRFMDAPSGKSFALFSDDGILKFRFNNVIKPAGSIQNPESVIQWAEDVHNLGLEDSIQRIKDYWNNITVMPLYARTTNPLIHDYRGSAFPDKYIGPNGATKYPTEYVAARLVDKAIKDGNDAVVYLNIRDPHLSTTYGIFKPLAIKLSTPFTFDDNKELIPLDERFNFDKNDLRFKKGGKFKMI